MSREIEITFEPMPAPAMAAPEPEDVDASYVPDLAAPFDGDGIEPARVERVEAIELSVEPEPAEPEHMVELRALGACESPERAASALREWRWKWAHLCSCQHSRATCALHGGAVRK